MDKVSNERLIQRMNKEKEIVNTIKTRKLQYLGHISRNPERYKIPLLLLKGKGEGRRGRKRTSWLQNLRQKQLFPLHGSNKQSRNSQFDIPRSVTETDTKKKKTRDGHISSSW
uniref:Uncharacterized protein n=1 Tax=Cacopsylla melanoneura TaxID=428564 RepID=A0A8D8RH83_9HEMI